LFLLVRWSWRLHGVTFKGCPLALRFGGLRRRVQLLGRALEDFHRHADAVNHGEDGEAGDGSGCEVADDGNAEVAEFSEERCHCLVCCGFSAPSK